MLLSCTSRLYTTSFWGTLLHKYETYSYDYYFQVIFIGSDFLVVPPETVLIPLGGGADLHCLYGDPLGIPRQVEWYRERIRIAGSVEGCSCRSQSHGFGTNLTFSNFMSDSVGEYGCWATAVPNVDECTFIVELAGK